MSNFKAFLAEKNGKIVYCVKDEKFIKKGRKKHFSHRKIFYIDTENNCYCRNLYQNSYNMYVTRFPEQIKDYYYCCEEDNEWREFRNKSILYGKDKLSDKLNIQISKSNINHMFRKIIQIASEI